jgi:tellurite methyltransferase
LPHGARVLDLGCGEGGNALFLARKGFDVVAIDIKKEGVEKLKAQATLENLKIETLVEDVDSYLKKCKEFDVIFGINILQFIPSHKINTVIKTIKRKTRPE